MNCEENVQRLVTGYHSARVQKEPTLDPASAAASVSSFVSAINSQVESSVIPIKKLAFTNGISCQNMKSCRPYLELCLAVRKAGWLIFAASLPGFARGPASPFPHCNRAVRRPQTFLVSPHASAPTSFRLRDLSQQPCPEKGR